MSSCWAHIDMGEALAFVKRERNHTSEIFSKIKPRNLLDKVKCIVSLVAMLRNSWRILNSLMKFKGVQSTHLKITFHRNRAAEWSPIKPLTQSKHMAQSDWRSNKGSFVLSILQMLCRYMVRGNNYSRFRYVVQALLRIKMEELPQNMRPMPMRIMSEKRKRTEITDTARKLN